MATSALVGSGNNEVQKDANLFKNQKLRAIRERTRERKNWRAYDGTDYGQWDEAAVRILMQEGRPPHTFNFIETKVDTVVGSLLTDEFQTGYETELGEKNNEAIMLNELFMEDKDLCNFEFEFLQFIRAGFIYRGYLQLYVDRCKDPRGRLAFRYLSPDRVQVDVDWKSNNIKDCKWIFISAWMSPEEIMQKYKTKAPEVKAQMDLWERSKSDNLQESEIEKIFDRTDEFYDKLNGLFLVIEKHELKQTTKMRLWDPLQGSFMPDQSVEDAQILQKMAHIQGQRLELLPKTDYTLHIHTFCPGISLELDIQKGEADLQTGGYNLFAFSANMINGHPNTLVDQLRDAQEAYNKRVSTATHILMTSANNALLIESDAIEDATELDRVGKQRNRPGAYFIVEPGSNSAGKIKHLEKNAPPNDFIESANQMLEVSDRLTPAVPALQAIHESNGESGILFQSKLAQAQVAMQIPQKFLKACWHQIGEAYLNAVKWQYTYPMMFQSKRVGTPFYLNVPGGIQVEEISRLKVIINQSPNSESFRRQLLQQYLALSNSMPDPATKMALARLVLQSLPGVPDEELAKLSAIAKLSEDYQKLLIIYQTSQLQAAMAPQMPQQMQAPAGMPPGMPQLGGGGGAPGGQPSGNAPQGAMPQPPPGVGPSPSPQGFMAHLPQHAVRPQGAVGTHGNPGSPQ